MARSIKTTCKHLLLAASGLMCLGLSAANAQESATEASGPLSFDVVLTTDVLSNVSGGIKTGTKVLNNLDLSVAWQGENGWEAFGYVIADQGGGFSETYVGDVQTLSNIDAPENVALLEAWVKKTNAAQTVTATFGAINLNSVFDANDIGGVFLNSSHGIGADYAQSGPSLFPMTSVGAIGEFTLNDQSALKIGLFDAVPGDPNDAKTFAAFNYSDEEGLHWVVEYQAITQNNQFKIGHWQNTVDAERIDGQGKGTNSGTYASVGHNFSAQKAIDDKGLKGWARIGVANADVQAMSYYVGAGLTYTGLIVGRDHDVLGFAVAHAAFGKAYRDTMSEDIDAETAFEVTYQAEIKPGLIIQPDIQYIHHPSGLKSIDDALVVGVRLRIGRDAFL